MRGRLEMRAGGRPQFPPPGSEALPARWMPGIPEGLGRKEPRERSDPHEPRVRPRVRPRGRRAHAPDPSRWDPPSSPLPRREDRGSATPGFAGLESPFAGVLATGSIPGRTPGGLGEAPRVRGTVPPATTTPPSPRQRRLRCSPWRALPQGPLSVLAARGATLYIPWTPAGLPPSPALSPTGDLHSPPPLASTGRGTTSPGRSFGKRRRAEAERPSRFP